MKGGIIILVVLLCAGCRQVYDANISTPQSGYLVIEGFINTAGVSRIDLSRTSPLGDTSLSKETDAVITVTASDNSVFPLIERDSGRYESAALTLNQNLQYQLRIITRDGREYRSAPMQPVNSTPLDSLTWIRTADGDVEIYVNARGTAENSPYYKFDYEETWEFHSAEESFGYISVTIEDGRERYRLVEFDSLGKKPNLSLYYCWRTEASKAVLIGSTTKLSSNTLYLPIRRLPKNGWELSVLYSISVQQRALSAESYEFYSRLRKNTESLGSIFDAQPSEMKGNIHNVDDPGEPVIGYVDVSASTAKRIFISNSQVPDWRYDDGCSPWFEQDTAFQYPYETSEAVLRHVQNDGLVPTQLVFIPDLETPPIPDAFYANKRECVDCRLRGTSQKPSFWP